MPQSSFVPDRLTDLAGDVALTSVARGDLFFRGASKWNNLAIGASGTILTSNGTDPAWSATPTITTSVTCPTYVGAVTSGGNLTLQSTSHSTKGKINLGVAGSYFDELNNYLILAGNLGMGGITAPGQPIALARDSAYNSEGQPAIRVLSSASSPSVALHFGTDLANTISFIQSMQPLVAWTTRPLVLQGNGGNLGIGTISQFGSGVGVIAIANCATPPSVAPVNAGILYIESGALKYRGPISAPTTLAPA